MRKFCTSSVMKLIDMKLSINFITLDVHACEPMRALRSNHGCFISINLPRTAVPLTQNLRSKQAPFGTIVVGT